MKRPQPQAVPVPPWLLVGLVVVCGVVAVVLLPSKRALLERQMQDRATAAALKTLRELSPKERAADVQYYALLELRLTRQMIRPADTNALRQQLVLTCEAYGKFAYDSRFLEELRQILQTDLDPAAAVEVVTRFLPGVPEEGQRVIYGGLVKRALAAGRPELAGQVYERFWESNRRSESVTAELIRLWRAAARPQKALETAEAFARQCGGELSVVAPVLARLRVDLLREVGRPGDAFAAMRELFKAATPAERKRLQGLLSTTAQQAGKALEVLPEVEQMARSDPQDVSAWRGLAELSLAGGKLALAKEALLRLVALEPSGTNHFKLGQVCEWSEEPVQAFEVYLKALAGGIPAAIQRLLALNPGLYRDTELAGALLQQQDLVFRAGQGVALARLLGDVGEPEQAVKVFQRLVGQGQPDPAVLREFGFLQADLYDYGLALSTLQQAAKRLPADGELKKAIAECLFRLHRYEESLAAYEEVVAAGADADTYDSYTTLAESLGKPDKVIAGLQGKLASTNLVAGMDYMRLAHLHARQGQTNQMRQAMQVGLSRFPEDPGLRLQLANALSDQRQWLEAARTLAPHPDLRTDPEIGGMYLSLLVQAQDFRSAAAYLASKPSPAVTNSVGYLEAAAQVHESEKAFETTLSIYARLRAERPDELRHTLNYGRMLAVLNRQKEAEAILHSLLGHTEPEVLKLAAEVYTAARKYRLAEQYQKRYLATNPPELHKEYGFLGDIRLSRGDKVNARRAYQRGLDHLYAKLAAEKGPAVSGLVRP